MSPLAWLRKRIACDASMRATCFAMPPTGRVRVDEISQIRT